MIRRLFRLRAAIGRWIGGERRRRQKDESESFLEHDIDARLEAGMSPAEARRTALAAFGGVSQVREQVNDARAGAWLEQFVRDARYAGRLARRSAGLSLAIIGSLALGIAAMVTAVAFVNGTAFGDFPGVSNQDRLVSLELRRLPGGRPPGNLLTSSADYDALSAGLSGLVDSDGDVARKRHRGAAGTASAERAVRDRELLRRAGRAAGARTRLSS